MRRCAGLLVLVALTTPAMLAAQSVTDQAALRQALRQAVAPALPFPAAEVDGTPVTGDEAVVWTVRWSGDEARIEVVANPLNPGNRQRALQAEQDIQRAVMASQQRSQQDYERAVGDFERTGEVSGEVRQISLADEGVAGERYDAESQVTVTATLQHGPHTFTVDSAVAPTLHPAAGSSPLQARVTAHEFGTPPRYAPEQAWLLFGLEAAPAARQPSVDDDQLVVPASAEQSWIVVSVSGNAPLVESILVSGQWDALQALVDQQRRNR